MKKCLTSTTRITSKYQTVVPTQIRKRLKLRVHDHLEWRVLEDAAEPTIVVSLPHKAGASGILGLGKSVWKGIKTDNYLKRLRAEWPQ